MANHRAEKPKASRRRTRDAKGAAPRTASTPTRALQQPAPAPSPSTPTRALRNAPAPRPSKPAPATRALRQPAPASRPSRPAPGTRALRQPAPAPRPSSPAPAPTTKALRQPAPTPTTRAPGTAGKRKAVKQTGHAGGRKNLFPALPSPPTLVGAAALALAAAGAVTVSGTGLGSPFAAGDFQKAAAQASVLNGASSIGSSDALSGRQRAVSRDSERQALQDAADQQLQAAAEAQAKERNAALAALAASAEKHANVIAKNAWQLPIPMGVYHLTARFGDCSALWSHCHTGLDFAAPAGTPIHAIAGGVVTDIGYSGAYGNRTIITLDDGTELWYCHQTSYNVSMGETVEAGDFIGTVGSTGNVTGPHLHLEVHPGAGDPVDPYAALVAHGINPG